MLTAPRATRHRVRALRHLPVFADCALDELARLDRLATPIDVLPGRALTREGTAGWECFVTLDGVAAVERAGRRIASIGAGSIAGEMALLDGTTRNATVVAESRMGLLVLGHREFRELLAVAPGVAARVTDLADERRAVDAPAQLGTVPPS